MAQKRPGISYVWLFLVLLVIAVTSPEPGFADTAKREYLQADSCYKKLRHSPSKKQRENEWLRCIKRYESIYTTFPNSSWAPAGMYKAANLYLTLARLSGKKSHEDQALDLLIRIRNKYPKSAYSGRSKALIARIAPQKKNLAQKPKKTASRKKKKRVYPHIASLKKKTRKPGLIKTTNRIHQMAEARKKAAQPPAPPEQKPVLPATIQPGDIIPEEDTTVTELRFWSNPEYTRIVVNAASERDYSHRLLKKDPIINKPFQRLYIDIEQARLGKNVAEHTPINDDLLKQARAGQYLPHTVRVVVDIKSFENYKIFSLKDPFRIVIDVWGKGSSGSPATLASASGTAGQGGKTKQYSTDNLESSDIARQFALGVRKIVIDPGHGGADPGAPGYYKNVWEKDIVLKIAKKLAVVLRDRLKCTVVLTRSKDRKLTLEARTAIANTQRADLFISLHCNAAKNRNLTGVETYILNLATDEQAIAVAARENATSEKNISDLEYILSDLMKHAKIEESTRLANVVHTSLVAGLRKSYSGISNLGVKRAPFYVLLGARMPSILIETSFISNPKECKRLMSDKYQTKLADSIADGIEKYIKSTNPRQL